MSLRLRALPILISFGVLAAAGPERPSVPRLVIVVSADGLSWDRLQYYRPWYGSGLRRMLDESLVEAEARYRHINTETARA